jgi:hypothetical protein
MINAWHQVAVLVLAIITASFGVYSNSSAAQIAPAPAPNGQVGLLEFPQPDLAGADPSAARQIHDAHAALADAKRRKP